MCSPKPPKQEAQTPVAPAVAPAPLASADADSAGSTSQLRIGRKGPGSLRIPTKTVGEVKLQIPATPQAPTAA